MAALRTGLLGKKLGMTQIFNELGDRTGVTVVHAGNCVVLGKRTPDKDGYAALRIGYGEKPLRLANRAEKGLASKLNVAPVRIIREVRLDPKALDSFEVGKPIKLSSVFKPGTFIDVTGTSKGKGFQGVIKRHHFGGGRATHGNSVSHRTHGSTGQRQDPGRVFKGKKMAGHLGSERVTTQNVEVVSTDTDRGLILIRGAVPGSKGSWILVRDAAKVALPANAPKPAAVRAAAPAAKGAE